MTKLFNDALAFKWDIDDSVLSDLKHLLMSDSQGKKRLLVKIDATHSGVLTNGRVYPYLNVKDAYRSFFPTTNGGTAKYPAPVLTHHDEYKDPIGRIQNARIKLIKSGDALERDYETPDPVGEKGSAAVEVEALISDEQSIQKILDGRYYTVSAGFSVKDMFCSICDKSIFKCDHIPMKAYDEDGEPSEDGYLCYGITDGIEYKELSFVNTPAQPSAQITSFKWEDAKNNSGKQADTLVSLLNFEDRSLINQATLITDKLEFDLLTGKESRRNKVKYSIAPTAQRKLKNFLSGSKTESQEDHSDNGREAQLPIETQIDNTEKGDTMTVKDDTNLEKTVATLTDKNESLTAELKTATDKVTQLEEAVSQKDARIESLESDVQAMKAEVTDMLATSVASLRIRLKKPDTVAIDSDEKRKEYTEKLAKRSIESLKDSLNDLTIEAEQVQDEDVNDKDLSDSRVDSPVLTNGDVPGRNENKDSAPVDVLDSLFN